MFSFNYRVFKQQNGLLKLPFFLRNFANNMTIHKIIIGSKIYFALCESKFVQKIGLTFQMTSYKVWQSTKFNLSVQWGEKVQNMVCWCLLSYKILHITGQWLCKGINIRPFLCELFTQALAGLREVTRPEITDF